MRRRVRGDLLDVDRVHLGESPIMKDGRENLAGTTLVQVRCRDCQQPFQYTEGYKRECNLRGFHPPRRCPACRSYLRAEQDAAHERAAAVRRPGG